MHALLPIEEAARANYEYRPRMVAARQAIPEMLKGQDVCILANCAVQPKGGPRGATLSDSFLEALESFVKKDGHGLIVFSGDNVHVDAYNTVLGKKLGLLPMPLKGIVAAGNNAIPFLDRTSFGAGPLAYRHFKEDDYFLPFGLVGAWRFVDLDEGASQEIDEAKAKRTPDESDPVTVIARLDSRKPFAVSKKAGLGEVIFVATAANTEGRDPKSGRRIGPISTISKSSRCRCPL